MQTQPSAVEALVRCLLVPVRVRVQMMALVLPVASIQQACDISQPAAQVCEDFCTSKCSFYNASAGETGQPTNITLYRITPKNVTGIQNKNTGDAPGDVSFFLGKKNIAQRCAQNPTSFGCFLDGDNIYGELGPPRSPDADPDHSHSPNLKQASSPSRSTGGTDLTSSATRSTSSNRYATPRHATPRHAALRHAAPCHATPRCTKQEADRISAATTHVEHGAYGQPMAGSFGPTPAWVDTRTFECGQGCLQPTADNCHDREQRNGTSSFGGGFSCWCDGTGRHNKSVGREAPPFHGGSTPGPAWWVPQCKLGFYEARARLGEQPVRCVKGKALRTVQGWDFQSVSAAACDACTQVPTPLLSSFPALPPPTSLGPGLSLSSNLADLSRSRSLTLTLAQPYPPPPAPHPPPPRLPPPPPRPTPPSPQPQDTRCNGWRTDDNRTATLLSGRVQPARGEACIGGVKYVSSWGGGSSWGQAGDLGGSWYSTPLTAECAAGQPLGKEGCSWRVVEETYRNASCVDGLVDRAVERRGAACLGACKQPLNRTGDCYLDCYKNTLLGDAVYNLSAMGREEIVAPWEGGFAPGGCPVVQPAACKGPQCGDHLRPPHRNPMVEMAEQIRSTEA